MHHIVFATHRRIKSITPEFKRDLYAYIFSIIKNNKSYLIRINGIEDHIHILVDIHPTVAIATLVKEVKQWSSHWLKGNEKFPLFNGWNDGYYAMSLSLQDLDACKNYIINQEEHHRSISTISEMEAVATENGFAWHPDDWK